jgi:Zn-dependent protease
MRWSFHLGRLSGIPVRVHYTFLLLLLWVAFRAFGAGASVFGALLDTAFVLAVFGSVVLHELGHALAARSFGVRTRKITLLPFGGVADLEQMPRSSRQELWIALAGPAVNLAIAAGLYVIAMSLGGLSVGGVWLAGLSFLASLMWANVGLAVFNMIPAFPMDGGRVFRALLARRLGHTRATIAAANVGRAFAIAFGIIGLYTSPLLVLVAVFLWLVAGRELRVAKLEQQQQEVDGWPAWFFAPTPEGREGPAPRRDRTIVWTSGRRWW